MKLLVLLKAITSSLLKPLVLLKVITLSLLKIFFLYFLANIGIGIITVLVVALGYACGIVLPVVSPYPYIYIEIIFIGSELLLLFMMYRMQEIRNLFQPLVHFKKNIPILILYFCIIMVQGGVCLFWFFKNFLSKYEEEIKIFLKGIKIMDNGGHFITLALFILWFILLGITNVLWIGFLQQRLYAILGKRRRVVMIHTLLWSLLCLPVFLCIPCILKVDISFNQFLILIGGASLGIYMIGYVYYKTNNIVYPILVWTTSTLIFCSIILGIAKIW